MAEGKGCAPIVAVMVAILALVVGTVVGGGAVYYVYVVQAPEHTTTTSTVDTTATPAADEPGYAVLYPLEQTLRIEGDLNPTAVKDQLLGKRFALRKCYQDGLEKDPDLKGEMSLQFTVAGSNGKVIAAVERHTEFPSSSVKNCILDEIKGWKFKGGRTSESVVKFDVLMLSMSASEAQP